MLIDNLVTFEPSHLASINKPGDPFFYFFDYDVRSYSINMEFQHFHPFYEIMILLDNAANHFIEGIPYALSQFDIVLLRPSLLHKSEYLEGDPSKRIIIQFAFDQLPPGLMEEFRYILTVFDAAVPIYRFNRSICEELFAPLNDIFRATGSKDFSRFYVHNRFMEFLYILSKVRYENTYMPKAIEGNSHKIYEITSYIHNNYMNELSLSSLAARFYMSTCYLSHQFKLVTGFTLVNYIQMTRIRNAQQMLLFTDRRITDIAESCGFTSFSQFNRMFNKFCGISPRDFKSYSRSGQKDQTSLDMPFDPNIINQ